jgi:hypothetical protein
MIRLDLNELRRGGAVCQFISHGLNCCRNILPAVAGATSESTSMGKALLYGQGLKRVRSAKAVQG